MPALVVAMPTTLGKRPRGPLLHSCLFFGRLPLLRLRRALHVRVSEATDHSWAAVRLLGSVDERRTLTERAWRSLTDLGELTFLFVAALRGASTAPSTGASFWSS